LVSIYFVLCVYQLSDIVVHGLNAYFVKDQKKTKCPTVHRHIYNRTTTCNRANIHADYGKPFDP